jgi:hypothetical protein
VVTVVDTEPSSSRRAKVNVERALWASAFIAGGVGVLGWWNPQGWKVLETVVGYPALWVSAAFVLLTISTFVGRRALFLRVVAVCVTCAVCLVGVGLTAFGIWWSGWEQGEVVVSPDDPEFRVVIDEGSDMIDPLWRISVEKGSGLTARRWDVTCINGDWAGYPRIEWTSSEGGPAFHIRSSGGPTGLVVLNPETGEPRAHPAPEC